MSTLERQPFWESGACRNRDFFSIFGKGPWGPLVGNFIGV